MVNNDTGWQVPTLLNGVTDYNAAQAVRYRRVLNTVYLVGAFNPGTTQPTGGTLFILPVGYRPSRAVSDSMTVRCQQSGNGDFGLYITSDSGAVAAGRGNPVLAAATWCSIGTISFLTDDPFPVL
jgi:hypothetical protein